MARRKRKKSGDDQRSTHTPEKVELEARTEQETDVEASRSDERAIDAENAVEAQAAVETHQVRRSPESEVDEADTEEKKGTIARHRLSIFSGEPLPSFLRHIHPKSVYSRSLEPIRTLGLGLLSLYMAIILTVTGVLLMIYYVPSAEGAYGSIQSLHAVVPFGGLVRNVHRWAGHAMVLIVALHLLRTVLTGSYKGGRHGVWTAGVWLMVLTLAFAFTGYLLPWDQLSYWAVSIGGHLAQNVPLIGDALSRGLLGGEEVNESTIVRFYALHVGILPFLTTIFVALHLYRLRRAGGIARPEELGAEKVPAWPHLYHRELALLALSVAVFIAAGLLFDAPLGFEPDMEHPDNPSKAPWYFLGLQELVSYSSLIGGVVIPALSVIVLYFVPFYDTSPKGAGVWLAPKSGRLAFAAGAVVSAAVVPAAIALHQQMGDDTLPWMNPASMLLVAMTVVAGGSWLRWRSPRLVILGVVGAGAVAVALLTIVGLALRGPSWALMMPWGSP